MEEEGKRKIADYNVGASQGQISRQYCYYLSKSPLFILFHFGMAIVGGARQIPRHGGMRSLEHQDGQMARTNAR